MSESSQSQNGSDSDSQISTLFDIRLIVGAILVVYGVVLFVKGLFDSSGEIAKGAGLRLNLWTGVALTVVGVALLVWMRINPQRALSVQAHSAHDSDTRSLDRHRVS